jgi:S1-C subfamily serine protease
LAAELTAETVAMVRLVNADGDDDPAGKPRPFCSGVWVSPYVFVTAGHCVAAVREMATDDANGDPVGYAVMFAEPGQIEDGSHSTGKILAWNKENDLGAVLADSDVSTRHAYAHLSTGSIEAGDPVEVVGHPVGYQFSFATGYVSAVRMTEPNANGDRMPTLQLNVAVSPGNSGCGAFDADGHIIGITSYSNRGANGMGFFVHRDAIRLFLRNAGAIAG